MSALSDHGSNIVDLGRTPSDDGHHCELFVLEVPQQTDGLALLPLNVVAAAAGTLGSCAGKAAMLPIDTTSLKLREDIARWDTASVVTRECR